MRIRREQGLLLVVVVLGLWIWSGSTVQPVRGTINPTVRPYEAPPPPADALVADLAEARKPSRDPFLEPSESSPLPPRALDFPELGPLPVVALPLAPGQHPAAYYQLRLPGDVVPFQFQTDGAGGAAPLAEPDPDGVEAAVGNGGGQGGDPGLLYDRITPRDGNPIYGFIRSPDKYGLVGKRGTITGEIVYDWVSPKDGRIVRANDVIAGEEVMQVELAETLRNRIELDRRRLGTGPGSLPNRRKFVESLLRDAEGEPWIYPLAESQAREYVEISNRTADGYRLLVSVLRARGDMNGEWKLYQELPEGLRGSSFQLCGMGAFEARLGLEIDAEQHLFEAVRLSPADPRCRLTLARFLLDRNRAAEALVHAETARRDRAVLGADEEFEVWTTLIETKLALGDTDVRAEVSSMPTGVAFGARYSGIKAAVEYASGEWVQAGAMFAAAMAAGGRGEAALGQAACQILSEDWQEAESNLKAIAAEYPLLRHRALAGLGLLYDRTGNHELSIAALESAARVDPSDAYLLYLLGRARRRAGQLDAAVEALTAALEQADDFAEAHAEMAKCYLELSDASGDQVESLFKARRHVDRVVELDADRGRAVGFLELQGLIRFRGADLPAAKQAFAAGGSSDLCKVGLALVEYARNRVDDARGLLTEMKRGLPTGEPMRDYVTQTIDLIDDHSGKEQVRDGFDRAALGRNWQDQNNGPVGPKLEDGVLHIRGRMQRAGRLVWAQRIQPTAGNFLQAEISLQLGSGDQSRDAVLEIATQTRNKTTSDFKARLGFRDQKPQLLIEDGDVERASDEEERKKWDPVELTDATVTPGTPQRLVLQVVPREGTGRLALRAYWNGELVHERPIEKLHAKAKTEMTISLLVDGAQGANVDVSFDDFRLVRRKETT